MPDYTMATGTSGTLRIRDTGTTVELGIKGDPDLFIAQMPWAYNGGAWRSFRFQNGGQWQTLGIFNVLETQVITLKLGPTGTSLGGVTEFSTTITRGSYSALIQESAVQKQAIPYIRVSGVWLPAQPWIKHEGLWKSTA